MDAESCAVRALRPQNGVEDEKRNEDELGRGIRPHWRPRLKAEGDLQALTHVTIDGHSPRQPRQRGNIMSATLEVHLHLEIWVFLSLFLTKELNEGKLE